MFNSIFDMCMGGVCIVIVFVYVYLEVQVDVVDISIDVLEVVDINIQEYGFSYCVYFIQFDLFLSLEGQKYDFIVFNLFYVDVEDMVDLFEEYYYEFEFVFVVGEDGLELVDIMFKEVLIYFNDGGWLFVEVGNSEVYMSERFFGLEVIWFEFDNGGLGIFVVCKDILVQYFSSKD